MEQQETNHLTLHLMEQVLIILEIYQPQYLLIIVRLL